MSGWIGVDFDGTLAQYHGRPGETTLGSPIPAMAERVKRWIAEGKEVRIMTARAWKATDLDIEILQDWCEQHIGSRLQVTCVKDYGMIELWDDRAVQIIPNTGERADGKSE